jgi:hypothetical protein
MLTVAGTSELGNADSIGDGGAASGFLAACRASVVRLVCAVVEPPVVAPTPKLAW